jgi:hypothetical protein
MTTLTATYDPKKEATVNHRSPEEATIGSTIRLISKAEQTEATGTIEIQRLLAWFYAADHAPASQADSRRAHDAA